MEWNTYLILYNPARILAPTDGHLDYNQSASQLQILLISTPYVYICPQKTISKKIGDKCRCDYSEM